MTHRQENELAELRSRLAILLKEGWAATVRCNDSDNDDAFLNVFKAIDKDGNGFISSEELERHLQGESPLVLAESHKFLTWRAKVKQANHNGANFSEFQTVVKDLYRCKYRSFCRATSFASALEQALFNAVMENRLPGEGSSLQPLQGLGALDAEERAEVLLEHCLQILPEVVAGMALTLGAERDYATQQHQTDPQGKFDKDMVLCSDWIFSQGLEKLIGFPEFSSDARVLAAMQREHQQGDHAVTSFTAWNHGKQRETTAAKEWDKMLPDGVGGRIHSAAYEAASDEPWKDLMQEEVVLKAKLRKYEVVGLRLYTGHLQLAGFELWGAMTGVLQVERHDVHLTMPVRGPGPMYSHYNGFLRRLGQQFEELEPKVRADIEALRARFEASHAALVAAASRADTPESTGSEQRGDGGEAAGLVVLSGDERSVEVDSLARCVTFSRFATVGYALGCRAPRQAYYELTIIDELVRPRFGFVSAGFERAGDKGVGDDSESWAVDGIESTRWHNGQRKGGYDRKWKRGDVIGVACDLAAGRVLVACNGSMLPPQGEKFVLEAGALPAVLYAAFSADCGSVAFNFGEQTRFAHAPPDGFETLRVAAGAESEEAARQAVLVFSREHRWRRAASRVLQGGDRAACQAWAVAKELKRSALLAWARELERAVSCQCLEGDAARETLGRVLACEAPAPPASALPALVTSVRDAVESQLVEPAQAKDTLRLAVSAARGAVAAAVEQLGRLAVSRLAVRQQTAADQALALARKEIGRFPYVTTVHAISSGLIKLSRVTPLPEHGKVYRGMAGIKTSPRFLEPNQFGSRVGNELGFMSTSTDWEQAIGYMDESKPYKQMFEIEVGQVDHGASIDFLSLFPGEAEVLFPPNSCLEVAGPARYRLTAKGLVMVWPLRVNINLKGRTIEDMQTLRKGLLVEAAENALHDVHVLAEDFQALPHTKRRMAANGDSEASVNEMLMQVRRLSAENVLVLRQRPPEEYNEEMQYRQAHEEVIDIRSLAEGLLDLWRCGGVPSAEHASRLELHAARQLRLQHAMTLLAEAKQQVKVDPERVASLALKLCRIKKLFAISLEERDSEGCTPLLRWSSEGYALAVAHLLDAGADALACTPASDSALHLAVAGNHVEIVQEWLQRQLPLALRDGRLRSALHLALERGHAEVVRLLLQSAGQPVANALLCTQDCNSRSPLHYAADAGRGELAQDLLTAGAPTESTDSAAWTPLHLAAVQGHAAVVRVLGNASASTAAKDKNQKTPLHLAAEWGHAEAVRVLLEELAAATDAVDEDERTALHWAARSGNAATVRVLVEHGANVEAVNKYVTTPLMLAAQRGHVEVVQLLAAKGANLAAANENHASSLHIASMWGWASVVTLLLRHGAAVDALDEAGRTALQLAAGRDEELPKFANPDPRGYVEVIEALLGAGAVLERRDKDERTGMHLAAERGHAELVRALMDAGAELMVTDRNRQTPRDAAAARGHGAVVELLDSRRRGRARVAGDEQPLQRRQVRARAVRAKGSQH